MTDPALAQEHRNYGRLYCLPGGVHPTRQADVAAAVANQTLLPSITNVIDVRNKPHLVNWAAKKAATAAVSVAGSAHAARLTEAPSEAIKWLTKTADRDRDAAADQGSNVHDACEQLAKGMPCPPLTENEMLHVDAWKAFLDRWQPEFLALEQTVFGQTSAGLRYAGTTDFIARIAGLTLVADYKCVTLDTPVLMADGTSRAARDLRAGDLLVAWSEEKGLHPAPVAWVADNGQQETYRITTLGGFTVQVTAEHPVLVARDVYGNASKFVNEWVKADSIKAGDRVHAALGWAGSDHKSDLSPGDAYLLGLLAGDGTTGPSAGYSLGFTNADPLVIEAANEHLAPHNAQITEVRTMPNNYRIGYDGVRGTGVTFRNWVEGHGLRCNAKGKRVPEAVKQGGPEVWAAFLSGLLDTDGYVRDTKDKARVSFHSINRDMITDVQQLMANLGVKASVTTVNTTYKDLPYRHYVGGVGNEYGIVRLAEVLTPRGARGKRLLSVAAQLRASRGGVVKRPTNYDLVKVTKVEHVKVLQPTLAIEVEGAHTHVTGGLITHNTTRSGLHDDVALQLSAVAHADFRSPDNESLVPMMAVDGGIAVHLAPDGYHVAPVQLDGGVWDSFQAFRAGWQFHAGEKDALVTGERSLGRVLAGPESLAGHDMIRAGVVLGLAS